jgi:Ca2+/H+ antiporter
MNWLLLFVPLAIGLEYLAPERHLLVFATSSLAILPLAGWMGWATEQLAERMGEGVGGLLNATFGNAAELIIALAALRAGLHDVVKGLDRRIHRREYSAGAWRVLRSVNPWRGVSRETFLQRK